MKILEEKCKMSISKYNVDMVIGNQLQTRRSTVFIYIPGKEEPIILEKNESKDLEEDIVELIKS